MRQLDYGRDNRLRLWFLGCEDWKKLDSTISPSERNFIESIKTSLINWLSCLKKSGKCILILGDSFCRTYNLPLPDTIEKIIAEEIKGYKLIFKMENIIPDSKRVRRNYK